MAKTKHIKKHDNKKHDKKKHKKSQSQTQKQKQIVNIKIGGNGESSNKTSMMPAPTFNPNIILNPSLSAIPNQLLNKQETNPPFYYEQHAIREQYANEQQQTQQINPPQNNPPQQATTTNINNINEKEKIKIPIQNNEKPTQAINNNELKPPAYDQSEPIQIEAVYKKTKHDINREQQKIIKPELPPEPKIEKRNDPEGLGKSIPIDKIKDIALTIGTGALTGGLGTIAEASLFGNLSTEALANNIIGGGVGAGVSSALGGGIISNVVGGITGSAISRGINSIRTRTREQGQRLGGGNSGFNRTTGQPINRTRNTRNELIPNEFRGNEIRGMPTTLESRTKEILESVKNRTSALSESISNIKNRLFGDGKGTYKKIPTSSNFQSYQEQRQKNNEMLNELTDRRNYDGNDIYDIERAMREWRAEQPERIFLRAPPPLEVVPSTRTKENKAATTIQNAIRNKQAIDKFATLYVNKAATTIQNFIKKRLERPYIQTRKKENKAASTIQALIKRSQLNPDIMARNVSNEAIKQAEYELKGQLKAKKLLSTVKPLSSISDTINKPIEKGPSPLEQAAINRRQTDKNIYEKLVTTPAAQKIQGAIKAKKSRDILKDTRIEARLNKYNKIGESMSNRNETTGNLIGNEFAQLAARKRLKRNQDIVSEYTTRTPVKTLKQEGKLEQATATIKRMDNIIEKRGKGRPRNQKKI